MRIAKTTTELTIHHHLENGPAMKLKGYSGDASFRVSYVTVTMYEGGGPQASLEGYKLRKDGTEGGVWVKPYVGMSDLPDEIKFLVEDAKMRHARVLLGRLS